MPVLIAVIVGLALRLLAVRSQGTYWFDEAFSAHFAALPFWQSVGYLIRDVHPTFYYIVLHFWISLFGDGATAVRVLSALTGTAAVWAIAATTRRVFGPLAAAVAAVFLALSPLLIFQSAEARMYPLLILLVALQIGEYLKLMADEKRSAWRWLVISALALFTHLTALTPFLIMLGHRLWTLRRDHRSWGRFAVGSVLALVPFLFWLVSAALGRMGAVGREWQVNAVGGSLATLSWHFTSFFANNAANWQRVFVYVALLACCGRTLFDLKREGPDWSWRVSPNPDRRAWLLAALAVLPFLAFVGVTTSVSKYFVVAVPAAAILVAGGFARGLPSDDRVRRLVLVVVAVLYVMIVAPVDATLTTGQRFRYDETARFIESRERPGDVVYAGWFPTLLPLKREYRGHLSVYAVNPYEPEISYDEALILHAGQSMTAVDTSKALVELERRTRDVSRVFLVTGANDLITTPVELWFSKRGWILEDVHKTNSWSPIVYQLKRP